MKKEKKDKDFIKAAYFEGGRAGIEAYVKKELRYPKEALEAKIEGTVSVRYTVDYKGKVIDANIIAGIGHGCDEEAIRIIRSMAFKVPNINFIFIFDCQVLRHNFPPQKMQKASLNKCRSITR